MGDAVIMSHEVSLSRTRTPARTKISFVLALSLVALSACGSDTSSNTDTKDSNDTQQALHVVISEINYHDVSDSDANDFIELFSNHDETVALTGWCLKGTGFCFTETTVIEPGEFVVIKGSQFDGRLGNKGERIRLTDAQENVRDEVTYSDSSPWPESADGDGDSLQRINTKTSADSPEAWIAAPPTPGEALPEGISTVYSSGTEIVGAVGTNATKSRVFTNVAHTRSPTADSEVVVVGKDDRASAVKIYYRYNFAPEIPAAMRRGDDGLWRVELPGSAPGTLIRYRLMKLVNGTEMPWQISRETTSGTSLYDGTVVASEADTNLIRLQWFMDDENFTLLRTKRELNGDTGFPAVFAINGEIVDNALIRIKGQESRHRNKNKYKVTLPADTTWDFDGLLEEPVNEFGLHSMLTDKSYSRELLTYELQKVAGGMAQQVFPLRLERNGEFYGLYLYHEQPDSRWRKQYGYNEEAVVIKGERISTLKIGHTYRSDIEMNLDYRRMTQTENFHQNELRWLIEQVNQLEEEDRITFAYRHIDIPQVVNALAVARVAQHVELEHKNWMMFYDPRDKKWRFQAIDHDLSFGKKWTSGCSSRCDEVFANPYMDYMQANRFARIFIKIPEFRQMLDRRTRTLADTFLVEGVIEGLLNQFHSAMEKDALLDVKKWGQYGEPQTLKEAQDLIVTNYAQPKRGYYFRSDNKYLPPPQAAKIAYTIDGSQDVRITSTDTVPIDISGVEIPSLSAVVPPGTVLLPGQQAVFTTSRVPNDNAASKSLHVFVES